MARSGVGPVSRWPASDPALTLTSSLDGIITAIVAGKNDVPILIGQSGPVAGQRWVLSKPQMTIGRDATCDIVIPDRQVSRWHALLRQVDGGFELEDTRSKNGTHVNGSPVSGSQRLLDGDMIQVALVAKLAYVGSEATMPLRIETTPEGEVVSVGRLRLDGAARRVWLSDRELDPPLSVPQFRFLELLYQRPGQVCSRDEVIQVVWPEASGAGVSEQAIDALVRRVRDRLAELDPGFQYIVTVRGHGFRLDNRP
jgi:pSer/pThr/pTyr-binding forkhead associated (FHA) protein